MAAMAHMFLDQAGYIDVPEEPEAFSPMSKVQVKTRRDGKTLRGSPNTSDKAPADVSPYPEQASMSLTSVAGMLYHHSRAADT